MTTRSTAESLVGHFGAGEPAVVAQAPGRVNLIGEHTDYNEGFVLPAPIDRFVEAAARRRSDRNVRILAADSRQTIQYELGDPPEAAWPSWAPYLYGLAEELRSREWLASGFELAVSGNVPLGAGLSSSAALEVASTIALDACFDLAIDPLDAVRLCHDVEHRWAGVKCGMMDQMASRMGRRGDALFIDCRDLRFRHVPLTLGEHRLVLVDSGVRRRLEDSAYNRRREECEEGVEQLRKIAPDIRSLRDVDQERLAAGRELLSDSVFSRCRHVVDENTRVLAAVESLTRDDLPGFGELMSASHESLRDRYEVSHPALDRLVRAASEVPGVLGSRLCGAGFGGCTLTLCASSALSEFRRKIDETIDELGLNGSILELGPAVEAGVVT